LLRKVSLYRQSPSPWWLQSDSEMGKKSTTLVSFTLRSLQSQLKNRRYSLESTAGHYGLYNREPSPYLPRIFHHTSVILISKSYSERKLLRHNYSTKWENRYIGKWNCRRLAKECFHHLRNDCF
jgi:hypothetical protein